MLAFGFGHFQIKVFEVSKNHTGKRFYPAVVF